MDLFYFIKILSIPRSMDLIVHHEHFLRDVIFVNLIWPNVWFPCVEVSDFIFFTYDLGSWINLPEIILNCVLNVHVCEGEHVAAHRSFADPREALSFSRCRNHSLRLLKQFDADRKKLVKFDD